MVSHRALEQWKVQMASLPQQAVYTDCWLEAQLGFPAGSSVLFNVTVWASSPHGGLAEVLLLTWWLAIESTNMETDRP